MMNSDIKKVIRLKNISKWSGQDYIGYLFNNYHSTELNLLNCGEQKCPLSYSVGPVLLQKNLIHYVISGKGTVSIEDKTYEVSRCQGFVFFPGKSAYYRADCNEPWHYVWVAFQGARADELLKRSGLSIINPVFNYKLPDNTIPELVRKMIENVSAIEGRDEYLNGLLYMFFGKLIENYNLNKQKNVNESGKQHSKKLFYKAVDYIYKSIPMKIKVSDVAEYIGIDRSYLFLLFKQNAGISPQEYIINVRIELFCKLISEQTISIKEGALSAGFTDMAYFSKLFKKRKKITPKQFKNNQNCN